MPRLRESEARNILTGTGWFQAAMMRPAWPMGSADAALLLQDGGGYRIDVHSLEKLVYDGIVERPATDSGGGFAWGAADVILAAEVLGSRRQYLDPKDCRLPEAVQAMKPAKLAEVVKVQDARGLLYAIVNSDCNDEREKLATAFVATLCDEHGVTI